MTLGTLTSRSSAGCGPYTNRSSHFPFALAKPTSPCAAGSLKPSARLSSVSPTIASIKLSGGNTNIVGAPSGLLESRIPPRATGSAPGLNNSSESRSPSGGLANHLAKCTASAWPSARAIFGVPSVGRVSVHSPVRPARPIECPCNCGPNSTESINPPSRSKSQTPSPSASSLKPSSLPSTWCAPVSSFDPAGKTNLRGLAGLSVRLKSPKSAADALSLNSSTWSGAPSLGQASTSLMTKRE